MEQPQAGWYPDPSGDPAKLRFWDGAQWTNSYMDNPNAGISGAAQPTDAADQPQQPDPSAQPYAGQPYAGQSAQPGAQPYTTQPGPQPYQPYTTAQPFYPASREGQLLRLIAFVFNVISTVSICWLVIPLAWMIPICVRSYGIWKGTKPNTVTFAVINLIFCSMVSGILLLIADKDA